MRRRQPIRKARSARARKAALRFRRFARSRQLFDLFDEIDQHWRSQNRADNRLIDELKRFDPRPAKLMRALSEGAVWDRGLDCDKTRKAIHCATLSCQNLAVFDWLVRLGADIQAPDARGDLFIHWAVLSLNLPAATWWLERGLGARALSFEGLSILELCIAAGAAEFALDLAERFPEDFPDADFTRALERVALIAESSESIYPQACASSAYHLLARNPALAPASFEFSNGLDFLGEPRLAAQARAFESAAIARLERRELEGLTPAGKASGAQSI